MFSFLSALPALLGLAGFIAYQLLRSRGTGDEITKRILDKLRRNDPDDAALDSRLRAGQVQELLEKRQTLKAVVGEQDFALLKQALRQQFLISVLVYSLAIAFCVLSVFLFLRQADIQEQVSLTNFSLTGLGQESKGLPVDHSDVGVSWQNSGNPEEVGIYLENVQTKMHTEVFKVRSTDDKIQIASSALEPILTTRELGKASRVRVVAQGHKEVFRSEPFDIQVGLTILTMVDDDANVTVAAMIDNQRVPYYDFQAEVLIPSRRSDFKDFVIGPTIPYRFTSKKIPNPDALNFSAARGVYLGPNDPRVVRFDFIIGNKLVARTGGQ